MDLDSIISATVGSGSSGGAKVVSEQNDRSQVTVDLNSVSWDEREYGMTREQAIATGRINPEAIKASALRRANLGSSNGKITVMSANTVPWHGLGTVISQAATSAEALRFAGLSGWDLKKIQAYVDFGDKRLETGTWGIVRGDTGKLLGTVGSRYQIVSNEECFAFCDDIVDGTATRYETAGAIGEGERVWLLAKLPGDSQIVPGDEIKPYVLFATSHDGSGAIQVIPTDVRVVCANTYRTAIAGRKRGISLRHTKNVRKNVAAAREAIGLVARSHETFVETAKVLTNVPVRNPVQFFEGCLDGIVDVTVAERSVNSRTIADGSVLSAILEIRDSEERLRAESAYRNAVDRRKELLDDILGRWESDTCNGIPGIAGSAWSAVNAVNETANHSSLFSYKGSPTTRRESRFTSIVDGRAAEISDYAMSQAMALSQ